MRARSLCLAAALTAVLAACGADDDQATSGGQAKPQANPLIVPKRSIAGVRLRDSARDVVARLGKPASTASSRLHGGWVEWRYRRPRLRVTLDDRQLVWSVRTDSRAHRSAMGVGVGTRERALRKAMSDLTCQPHGGPPRFRRWRVCVDTTTYSGPFTSFTLVRGRVRYVTVAQGLAR